MTLFIIAVVLALAILAYVRLVQWCYPAIGRFLDCDGVRLHYIERGRPNGPPLVLLHGNGAMVQDLLGSGLVDLAAREYRVLCFDRPGYGYSSRPRLRLWTPDAQAALLEKALAQLGIRDPLVVGHSWGAIVALALALRGGVKGLVLAGGYYFPTRRADVWLAGIPAIPLLGDLLRYTIAPIVAALLLPAVLRRIFRPNRVSDGFRHCVPIALALRPRSLRACAEEAAFTIPAAARLSARYGALSCPVAVVAGERDWMIEPDQAPRLQQALPHAVIDVIPDTGHMMHHDVPDRVMEAIDRVHHWHGVNVAAS